MLGFKRKKKTTDVDQHEWTMGKHAAAIQTELTGLIIRKEVDLEKEVGSEQDNRKKLAQLRTMQFHLDTFIEGAGEYADA